MVKLLKMITVAALLVGGCVGSPAGVQFTADVGGTPFRAVIGWWEESSLQGLTTGQIVATDSSGSVFTLFVGGRFEEKTYSLGLSAPDRFESFATYAEDLLGGTIYMSQSGTLTITSRTDDRLSGTFTVVLGRIGDTGGGDTVEVTNGSFDLPIAPSP